MLLVVFVILYHDFMKLSRLQGRKTVAALQRKGSLWRGATMNIRWLPQAPRRPGIDPQKPAVYVGTSVSAKVSKKAVERNRMRRRCREALRTAVREQEDLPVLQLLITPRSRSLDCDFTDIQADIRSFLVRFT